MLKALLNPPNMLTWLVLNNRAQWNQSYHHLQGGIVLLCHQLILNPNCCWVWMLTCFATYSDFFVLPSFFFFSFLCFFFLYFFCLGRTQKKPFENSSIHYDITIAKGLLLSCLRPCFYNIDYYNLSFCDINLF